MPASSRSVSKQIAVVAKDLKSVVDLVAVGEPSPALLRVLRRARALLLFGDLGVPGIVNALQGALVGAADDIRERKPVNASMNKALDALAKHSLRIPKGDRLLVPALRANEKALGDLRSAMVELARGRVGSTDVWRGHLHAACVEVGVISERSKVVRDLAAVPWSSGYESPQARSVRMSVARAVAASGDVDSWSSRAPRTTRVRRSSSRRA
jgi:hypothetical protein